MALGAAACFAVYLLATEKVRETIGMLAFLRLAIFSGTIAILLINLVLRTSLRVPNTRTWWALLGLELLQRENLDIVSGRILQVDRTRPVAMLARLAILRGITEHGKVWWMLAGKHEG
jgi:branched-subunit amino acid ABC-type transport system permease component